jgi:DNA mismatch repair protein MutS
MSFIKEFYRIKEKYPDALILFAVNDFYETIGDDAVAVSQCIGTVLTHRKLEDGSTLSLTGFAFSSLDQYLPKLIRCGYRVAIVDQLRKP